MENIAKRCIRIHPRKCLVLFANSYLIDSFSRGRRPTIYEPILLLQHLVTPYTETEKAGLKWSQWFRTKGEGYLIEHATQPQTMGYSLTDSPVGLLAWIFEKLVNWTDEYPWEDDEGM